MDESFDEKRIKTSVTDTGIQKILLEHLRENANDPKVAFSPDGIERMNANLQKLNGGKARQPIYKVRVYEHASKFAVGSDGNKKDKYVDQDNTEWAKYYLNQLVGRIKPYERPTTPDKGAWDISKYGLSAYTISSISDTFFRPASTHVCSSGNVSRGVLSSPNGVLLFCLHTHAMRHASLSCTT